jgi:hypothetical protein
MITLNALFITFDGPSVYRDAAGQEQLSTETIEDDKRETVTWIFAHPLQPGGV